ncbi:uncharacterized protein LOC101855272 [Aplysia californica]|uniref:Uncharacterized protein LOC101855272 n=1 Tax=Aplysia californica TaxID=6500 RepID=A0ABM0JVX3_APLCA|nr:uncharacterized protein LOC101855272 [Aplysia californica]XP_005102762.2 uncharacterized protein LOC101855272 [Aplysia californica]XP_005102763.2 uncharacterized protein LOC101855272 [Aplysia californica]
MDGFRINFGELHGDMKRFLELVVFTFNNSAPHNLRQVTIISDILRPNDSIFKYDAELAIQKFFVIHDLLNALLKRGYNQIIVNYQGWFGEQRNKLLWLLGLVKMSLIQLRLEGYNVQEDVSVLSAGIGGINTSTQKAIGDSTMSHIDELVFALRQI